MLIVFEGIDGSGKDTQLDLLRKELKFDYFKYPTKKFGILNDYLEKKLALASKSLFHLFLADIANEQEAVAKSKFAVLDRYVFSTIAYELDGINYANAKKIVEASNFLKPDLVLYLDLTSETAQARKSRQKALDRYEESAAYLGRVRANYLKLFKDKFLTDNWRLVDASKGIGEVHAQVVGAMKDAGVNF
ncbi:MAG: dTMP kinase [Candidatus ainarchaeum sp.]|nr:dTMP kinase [Candidatus ainarchaeum sp.]